MVGVPHLTGRQKLFSALLVLASGAENIEQRLEAAYRLVNIIDPQLDLPPELVDELENLRAELQRVYFLPSANSERPQPRWASEMAKRLVALYDKLARLN